MFMTGQRSYTFHQIFFANLSISTKSFSIHSSVDTKFTAFVRQQQLYFIPVLIYTPNKVKSEQREEKRRFIRQANQFTKVRQ